LLRLKQNQKVVLKFLIVNIAKSNTAIMKAMKVSLYK